MPTSGQILVYNGTEWTHVTPPNNTYTPGTGISITNNVVTNTGDTNANDDVNDADPVGGDVSGTFNNVVVNKLKGKTISATAPTEGQYLKFTGGQWTPTTPPAVPSLLAGAVGPSGAILYNTGLNISDNGEQVIIGVTGVTLTASNNALVATSRTTGKTLVVTYTGGNAVIAATSGVAFPCSFILML